MTSKNTSLKLKSEDFAATDVGWNRLPFLLKPVGKDYLWGGNRLNEDYNKEIAMTPLAETWECSTHPDGVSRVECGAFRGQLLTEVLKAHPDFLGSHPHTKDELPILIKFIDAKQDLSVQVHPSDDYARKHENGSMGKSEMWYVLDAAEDTKLIHGFYHDMDAEKLRNALQDGSVEKYLRRVPVKKDDVFFVEAGTVHAIGAGALIAEIQESSNLTYRLYDYNRMDKDGRKRELHIEKALAVADLKSDSEPRQPLRLLQYRPGYASELLCRCKYFQVERVLLNTSKPEQAVEFRTGSNSFWVFLCLEGRGVIRFHEPVCKNGLGGEHDYNESFQLCFHKGDCIFVPADSPELMLEGTAQLLRVQC